MIAPTTSENLEWIRTEFNLPLSKQEVCQQFFMRVWSGDWIMSNMKDGALNVHNRKWIAHFQSTPAIVRGASRVACSFREYEGRFYVVIKLWKE